MQNCIIRFTLLFLFSILSLSVEASTLGVQDSVGVLKEGDKTFIQYVVSPGETIYRISTTYGVSISELLELNPDLENGLKVGQEILIPFRPKMQHKEESLEIGEGDVIHEVQSGETLYSLSRKYNVSVGDLLKWNGMELKAGQKLVVKKKNPTTTTTTAQPKVVELTKEEVSPEPAKVEPVKIEPTKVTPVVTTPKEEVKETTIAPVVENKAIVQEAEVVKQVYRYRFDSTLQQVLIIPFDPHLYFSDADDEIAKESHVPRVKVREVFRRRLDALLDPPGYEVIHLMGGRSVDSLLDLNKIYSSVTYNYQEILESEYYSPLENHAEIDVEDPHKKQEDAGLKGWMNKQKQKITHEEVASVGNHEKFEGKYFGVQVRNPNFFEYFGHKYSVDYYIFINEFEVMTDYEHCLDRSAQNYQREFVVHYSIFDAKGQQFAGNKFKVYYPSNSNDIMRIVADNVGKISQRILNDLPKPGQRK